MGGSWIDISMYWKMDYDRKEKDWRLIEGRKRKKENGERIWNKSEDDFKIKIWDGLGNWRYWGNNGREDI